MTVDRNWPLVAWLVLLAASLVFGGGGANYGLLNLAVQLVALLLIALRLADFEYFWRNLGGAGRVVLLATLALPLLQAIPIPPAWWQALPGRDLVLESLALIGGGENWSTISIDPRRTILAATALVVPIAAAAFVARQSREGLVLVMAAIGVAGILAILLGLLQIAGGNDTLSWFARKSSSRLYGFFANRNSSGLFFVIATICVLALPARIGDRRIPAWALYGTGAVLALATVLTQSRSATLLLVLPAGFFVLRLLADRGRGSLRKSATILAAAATGLVAVGALAIQNDRLAETWERFDTEGEMRWAIWQDSVPAIEHYWPVGSGMGGFRDTIEVFESLETVTPLTSGRAHNEYLEVAMEAGIFGLALIIAWWALCAVLYIRALRTGGQTEKTLATAAMLSFAAIALQSAVDYPLRNLALMCVMASLFGMLVAIAGRGALQAEGSEGVE